MSVRPFLLFGESERRLIGQRVAAGLDGWRSDWLAEGAPEPAPRPHAEPRAARWLAARGATAVHLLLGCRDGWLAQLGALATAQPEEAVERAPALAVKLGEAMLEALAARIFAAFSAASVRPMPQSMQWDAEGAPQAGLEPGAGGAIYDLSPFLPVIVALSPELVAASLPKAKGPRPGRESLAARLGAVEGSRVELDAVVGGAELQLGELARLAAGDVIILERRLDEPLALQLGAQPVARVHLGTAAGARAVQVVMQGHN